MTCLPGLGDGKQSQEAVSVGDVPKVIIPDERLNVVARFVAMEAKDEVLESRRIRDAISSRLGIYKRERYLSDFALVRF